MNQILLHTAPDVDTADEITDHVLDRILATETVGSPCYHKALSPALPSRVYDALTAHLPPDAAYRPARGANHTRESIHEKLGCASTKEDVWLPQLWDGSCPEPLTEARIAPWRDVYAGLSARRFIDGLTQALGIRDSTPFKPSIRLVRECGAAYVRPHLDRRKKILTIVFYIGDQEESGAQGTVLHGSEPEDEEGGEAMPFVANTALFLPRLPDSWHAVPAHRLSAPRLTLQFFLIHSPPE